jgi:methionine-rich copper-binding protein CopC
MAWRCVRAEPGAALAATLVALLALAPAAAGAHAFLVKSSPARRAALAPPPARIDLWFNERLEPAYSTVTVWKGETRVDGQDARVAADDPKRLTVSLPPLAAGEYTVRFRVLSVDGHVVESSYPFTVRGAR